MLKKMLKKIFVGRKTIANSINSNIIVGEQSVLLSNTSFRNPENHEIKIGVQCMINCNFIFESDKGKITIGDRVFINSGTNLISRNKIEIGNDVTIAWGCTIYDHNSHSIDWKERKNDLIQQLEDYHNGEDFIKNKNWSTVKSRPIKICDKVWIGFDCTILSGVTIGEGAIIGAKSVIREDVPPFTLVAGNPAKFIKKIKHD